MKVIRKGVFETNSSTTHSCVIMTEDEHKKWEDGLYYYRPEWYDPFKSLPEEEKPIEGNLYTQEEVLKFLEKIGDVYTPNEEYSPDDFIYEEGYWFVGYSRWRSDEYLEYESNERTLPNGETIIVECMYGHDG